MTSIAPLSHSIYAATLAAPSPGAAPAPAAEPPGRPLAELPKDGRLPLAPYPSSALQRPAWLGGLFGHTGSQTLVALDGEVSAASETELTARRVALEAIQSRLQGDGRVGRLPGGHPLARFAAGTLDHAYVDTAHFKALAGSGGGLRGDPARYPVYVDEQSGTLVVDLQRAFLPGDHLSAAARKGLAEALGAREAGLADADWLPAAGPQARKPARRLAGFQPATGATAAAADEEPRPIRRRNKLHLDYGYGGKKIGSETGGADFYFPNKHHGIADLAARAARHRAAFSHPNYLANADGGNVDRKEIIIHRGMIDNRNGVPENSIAAIDSAYQKGYYGIEIDVQVTADGVPILMHDFTAGRMTADRDNRLVGDIQSADILNRNLVLRRPDTGDFVVTGEKVPSVEASLRHVLENNPGMSVFLDCKESTPDAAIALLIDNPEFRPMAGVKLYGRTYAGGFHQLVGNLQARYGIHPSDPADRGRRQQLLADLKDINLVPILSEGFLRDADMLKYFLPNPLSKEIDPAKVTPEQMAAAGLGWLDSWRGLHPVVVEAVQTDKRKPEGQAMGIVREALRDPSSAYAKIPFSGSYRYEDFSHNKQYFTWDVHGGIKRVPGSEFDARRGTAGAFRDEAENLLTDQPDEEVLALVNGEQLERGHSGYEIGLPAGAAVDTGLNHDNVRQRLDEFLANKPKIDHDRIAAVGGGMIDDREAGLDEDGPAT